MIRDPVDRCDGRCSSQQLPGCRTEPISRVWYDFARLVRERDADALDPWLNRARAAALGGFASGLSQDIDAVRAALSLPWSNGPAEGQVNRLKTIKRSMYGRAKFDLLRSRVLHTA